MLGDILPATSGRHLSGAVAQPAQGTPPGSRAAHGCCQGSHDTWVSVLTPLGRALMTGHLVTAPSPLAPSLCGACRQGVTPIPSMCIHGLPLGPRPTCPSTDLVGAAHSPSSPLSWAPTQPHASAHLYPPLCCSEASSPWSSHTWAPPPAAPPLPWLVLTQAIPSTHDSLSDISAQVPANCSHLPWGGARGPQFQELMADPTCLPQGSAPCSRFHSLPSNRRPILHPLTRHAALRACHTPVPTSRGSLQHKQHCSPSAKNSPMVALLSG